jgi:hypothetical protein
MRVRHSLVSARPTRGRRSAQRDDVLRYLNNISIDAHACIAHMYEGSVHIVHSLVSARPTRGRRSARRQR